jgi:hypothetical protein
MSRQDHLRDEDLGEALTRSQQRHLGACSRCAQRRSAVLAVQGAVRSLPRTAEPPASALALLDTPPRRRRFSRTSKRWLLAASLAVAATTVVFVVSRRQDGVDRGPMGEALAQEIALDHLHYERNAGAAEVSGDLERIEAYFAKSLNRPPRLVPIEGTDVVGGKRCRIGGGWSALVWLQRAGHWLSFFSMPQDAVVRRGCTNVSGVNVCGIPDPRGGSRVLAGNLPDAEMLRLLDESTE